VLRAHRNTLTFLLAASLLAGCGGNDDATTGASTNTPAATGSAVTINDFKFAPATLTAKRDGRVTVSNDDSTAHTATADDGSSFDTGQVDPGASKAFTLSKPGRYAYHCSIHPFMHGTIVVK
jgi:plastocyanin